MTVVLLLVKSFMKDALELVTPVSRLFTQSKKLLVLTWFTDCKENNKKAMKFMISSEDENLLFLQPYLKLFMLESV